MLMFMLMLMFMFMLMFMLMLMRMLLMLTRPGRRLLLRSGTIAAAANATSGTGP